MSDMKIEPFNVKLLESTVDDLDDRVRVALKQALESGVGASTIETLAKKWSQARTLIINLQTDLELILIDAEVLEIVEGEIIYPYDPRHSKTMLSSDDVPF